MPLPSVKSVVFCRDDLPSLSLSSPHRRDYHFVSIGIAAIFTAMLERSGSRPAFIFYAVALFFFSDAA